MKRFSYIYASNSLLAILDFFSCITPRLIGKTRRSDGTILFSFSESTSYSTNLKLTEIAIDRDSPKALVIFSKLVCLSGQ